MTLKYNNSESIDYTVECTCNISLCHDNIYVAESALACKKLLLHREYTQYIAFSSTGFAALNFLIIALQEVKTDG